jgi:hypothetical protein
MHNTNKNEANKASVLEKVDAVRSALRAEPASARVVEALAQCDRLQLAISQFHAEGLRFAAFTLLRMTQSATVPFSPAVATAAQNLKAALDSAGFPH